jgi:hypothetical protein
MTVAGGPDEAIRRPAATPVELDLPGFPIVRGQRWGEGAPVVLLAHEPGTDLDVWGTLPALLALRLDAAVEAFDLPGHGLADDPWQPERLDALIAAMAEARRDALGAPAIVAAGESAGAALVGAGTFQPMAVVALSPAGIDPDRLAGARSPLVPKLFFAGALDADALPEARRAANELGGWAVVSSVPTADRGTAILAGPWGDSVAEHAAGFLREALARRLLAGNDGR